MQTSIEKRSENRIAALTPAKRGLLISTTLLVVFLFFYALAEVGVRARMYIKYGTFWGFEIKAYDSETGLRLPKPNSVSGQVRINSLGFRSPELTDPKPGDLLRLAFLGGSTTFCQEVSNNEVVWPAIVTRDLSQSFPEQSFDHINASATALTVSESLINLEKRVAKHDPDIVVIYHAVNDIAVNGAKLAAMNGQQHSNRPTSPWIQRLLDTSLLADLIYKNLLILLKQQQAADMAQKIAFDKEFMSNRFREDMSALVAAAEKTADLVVIPTFSNQLRAEQAPERQLEAAQTHLFHIPFFGTRELLQAFDTYNEVIREFTDREKVLIVETESVLPGTPEFFIDSVHFTDTGSISMGQHLARELGESSQFEALLSAH